MKFYIAARTSQIPRVREYITMLEEKGHVCTHDWTQHEKAELQRPYEEHLELASEFAVKDVGGGS
ncbi:hypothetical protein H6784_04030 [Candidatus Nomurabacteria bacterium]|nr:hypothetical protein [Candidatus Nomurabacteria bacterium]